VAGVILATCRALTDGDDDHELLASALATLGVGASLAVWDDPSVDFDVADLVVVRSTWDYTDRRAEFLAWAASVERLANPAATLAWNTDKRYLDDLGLVGLPVISTTYPATPGDLMVPDTERFVIKPTVGAGSKGARRFDRSERDQARAHVAVLLAEGRVPMVQPYLESVDARGETDVVLIDGVVSHAIEKRSMLGGGPLDASGLFVEERIRERTPTSSEVELACRALVATRVATSSPATPLYARVDLIDGPAGPLVVEVELTEPSLFLAFDEEAPQRLAEAIVRRLS